ncbi:MAG: hypothetical protein U0L83_05215 [Muribaculaceae bacterium]|nr:hypothetical protein [Muribaculaceae bacterium]
MSKLFIFNPHTDFARADTGANYTPKSKIRALACDGLLTQLPFASAGDVFLVPFPDCIPSERHLREAADAGCGIIGWHELRKMDFTDVEIEPWGWDPTLRRVLAKYGVPVSLLPSESDVETIRTLSHRRITIPFHQELKEAGLHRSIPLPAEVRTADELKTLLAAWPDSYLKAPWSSSGRGIWPTANARMEEAVQWASGIISRQGSVMVEKTFDGTFDFASEWMIESGEARFLGYSVFSTSGRAVYKGNALLPQHEIEAMVRDAVDADMDFVVDVQRLILDRLVSPHYSGPAGIDMLADGKGEVNACLELNLRTTMGHVALERQSAD